MKKVERLLVIALPSVRVDDLWVCIILPAEVEVTTSLANQIERSACDDLEHLKFTPCYMVPWHIVFPSFPMFLTLSICDGRSLGPQFKNHLVARNPGRYLHLSEERGNVSCHPIS